MLGAGRNFTSDVDREVGKWSHAHDPVSEYNGKDFGTIEPGCAINHPNCNLSINEHVVDAQSGLTVNDREKVDAKNRKASAHVANRAVELPQHDRGVDLEKADTRQAGKKHPGSRVSRELYQEYGSTYLQRPHVSVKKP